MHNQLTAAIVDALSRIKGQYVSVSWKSEVTPSSAHKGVTLEKHTRAVCRAGVSFERMQSVKNAIAKGERPDIQPLAWGQWKDYPHTITHKGQDYVRLYPSTNNPTHSTYYANGQEVTKDKFASFLAPSKAKKLLDKSTPQCFTVKASNLIDVKIK